MQYLEAFRGLLLLGSGGVRETIRMGPDPLQGLDRTIKGSKEGWRGCVPQRLPLVGCPYFLGRSSLRNTKDRIIIGKVGHGFCRRGGGGYYGREGGRDCADDVDVLPPCSSLSISGKHPCAHDRCR